MRSGTRRLRWSGCFVRLSRAVDVQHTGASAVVRIPLGEGDTSVRDDRAVPVSRPRREPSHERARLRTEDAQAAAAARVVEVEKPAGDDRARAPDSLPPDEAQAPPDERERLRA